MPAITTPFHQQAEDVGKFLSEDRERDAHRTGREQPVEGPSENAD